MKVVSKILWDFLSSVGQWNKKILTEYYKKKDQRFKTKDFLKRNRQSRIVLNGNSTSLGKLHFQRICKFTKDDIHCQSCRPRKTTTNLFIGIYQDFRLCTCLKSFFPFNVQLWNTKVQFLNNFVEELPFLKGATNL